MLDHIPLEAFRVFDRAARAMNFSEAARSLNITQAAVSRRIKGLEEVLGAPLFTRRGRNLALTAAGARLAQRVRATLEYLEEGLEPFRDGGAQPVSIAASGSVSHLFLGDRLQSFLREAPETRLRLTTSDSPSDLSSEAHDLVILYTSGEHPRWALTPLMEEVLMPVAAPAYLAARGLAAGTLDARAVAGLDLIDYERFNAHWIPFRQWFARAGHLPETALPRPRLSFSTYALAIEAAVKGEGVALGSLALIDAYLRDGRLVPLGQERLRTGFGYYLGTPRYRPIGAAAQALHDHLLRFAAA